MPVFHFHSRDGETLVDADGLELATLEEARAEAIRATGELLRDKAAGWDHESFEMTVTDAGGRTLFTIVVSARPPLDASEH